MGQVYLEQYEGPLYAFVEFKVGGLTVTSSNGYDEFEGGEKYSLNHITEFENGDTYISNVVMSFSYTKESSVNRGGKSWGVGQEFNITVFDDSAVYVEDIIAQALNNTNSGANCHIEYGWSAQGEKIDERCCVFDGIITEYTLSFEGSSTSISIVGTTTSVISLGTTYTNSDSGEPFNIPTDMTASGCPSEIVKYIVDNILNRNTEGITYKYDDTTIVKTAVYIEHEETQTPRNLICNSKSIVDYITNDLTPYSYSFDGHKSGYVFYTKQDPSDSNTVWIYFEPQASVDNTIDTSDDDDNTNSHEAYGDKTKQSLQSIDSPLTRTYNYYAGFQQGEVLSYSSDFKGFATSAGAKFTSAIDITSNEMVSCAITGSTDEAGVASYSSASRIMGLSSGNRKGLDLAMRDLWNKFATQVYNASLEIMGDPNICVMDTIQLNVYTKYNQLHHTSGEYLVQSLEDTVDSSGFTTSISLIKKGAIGDITTTEDASTLEYMGDIISDGVKDFVEDGNKPKYDERGFLINDTASSPVVSQDGTGQSEAKANKPTVSLSGITSVGLAAIAGISPIAIAGVPADTKIKGESEVANPVIYD